MTAGTAPGPVLVVGDANVDLVLRGDVVPRFGQAEQLLDDASAVLGGSAAILACGLARLGVPTTLAAVVGDDAFGGLVTDALRTAGVRLDAIERRAGVATGLSVHLSAPHDRAILTHPGALPLLTADAVRSAATATAPAWVHVASPFLLTELAGALPPVLAALRRGGVGVSVDTNWDPAERWASAIPLLAAADVLLPNRAELAALGAAVDAAADPADALTALGLRIVVKDGADGGWSQAAGEARVSAPGLAVDVVDTTGAGDSFDAGYLAAIAHGIDDESQRLRWATAAGSLSTRGAGGTGAQPTLDELLAAIG